MFDALLVTGIKKPYHWFSRTVVIVVLSFSLTFFPQSAYGTPDYLSLRERVRNYICISAAFLAAGVGLGFNLGHRHGDANRYNAMEAMEQGHIEPLFHANYPNIVAQATAHGNFHAGNGLVFDVRAISALWTAEERSLIEAPRTHENQVAILEKLVRRLHHRAHNQHLPPIPDNYAEARFVSNLLRGAAGDCRDKAITLAMTARFLGIKSTYVLGRILTTNPDEREWHVWVLFEDHDLIGDPTLWPELIPAHQYRQNEEGRWIRQTSRS